MHWLVCNELSFFTYVINFVILTKELLTFLCFLWDSFFIYYSNSYNFNTNFFNYLIVLFLYWEKSLFVFYKRLIKFRFSFSILSNLVSILVFESIKLSKIFFKRVFSYLNLKLLSFSIENFLRNYSFSSLNLFTSYKKLFISSTNFFFSSSNSTFAFKRFSFCVNVALCI